MRNISRPVRAIGMSSSVLFALLGHASLSAQENTRPSAHGPLAANEIVRNLEERNRTRAQALHRFEGSRIYSLHYRGFPHNYDAEMVVTVTYQSPASKDFTVVSQSGSKLLIDHVLKKMIESEKEAVQQQSRTELNEQNYEFTMAGYEETPGGANYVLSVSPRSKNKFLYRGKIWVDASDFAVTRIEAAPAQNPSFWIKKTDIRHAYKKVGDFWLPAENHSQSSMRVGGRADLSIEYKDYKITAADPLPSPTERLAHTAAPKPVAAE
ncbi:MAG TPA: hypothetical protein VNY29_03695 [Terriglobales bacterium]|nr:hypothetical protein [Terriglobales bacterium]